MSSSVFHKLEIKSKIPSIVLGIFAFCLIAVSQMQYGGKTERPRVLIAPPQQIERMAFGFQEVMADSLWIRAIQDLDYCEMPLAKHLCAGNSWLARMLDAVTDLSPKFRMPYAVGGLALTVIVSDYEGATKIFDKGVKQFPKDWPILYRAAYHYLYEVKDQKRAAELMIAAAQNGGPPWLYTLAGRTYSDSGNVALAEALLQDMIASGQDEQFINRLREKIESMKKQK
ncbi:hypothetical protein D3C87_253190 [compost metagenome]